MEKRFCRQFSESSTSRQARGTLRKLFTKPLIIVTLYNAIHVLRLSEHSYTYTHRTRDIQLNLTIPLTNHITNDYEAGQYALLRQKFRVSQDSTALDRNTGFPQVRSIK